MIDISKLSTWSWDGFTRNSDWKANGDEWTDQATHSGQPYETWKTSLIQAFVVPFTNSKTVLLEIAPGRGRWTEMLVRYAATVYAVDCSRENIEYCSEKFATDSRVKLFLNDGRSLPQLEQPVDLVWSYDSFVHFSPVAVYSYLKEFRRILIPKGFGVIHHAGTGVGPSPGGRAMMTKELFAEMVDDVGLTLVNQTDRWGANGEFNNKLFGDVISIFQNANS